MKAKEIIGEGVGSLIGKGLVKLGNKMAGQRPLLPGELARRATVVKPLEPSARVPAAGLAARPTAAEAELAAELAALKAAKEPGIIRKAIGKGLKYGTIGSGVAGAGHYLADPDKPNVGVSLGRGATDVAGAVGKGLGFAKDFAADVYRGATGADTAMADAPDAKAGSGRAAKPSSSQAEKEVNSNDDQSVAAPEPEFGSYVRDTERLIQKNLDSWPGQQNESIKKKFAIAEADNRSSFELEVEKNFPDPYVRKAIMAKARQESGGRNIGEKSYAGNTNDYIRKIFRGNPHLAKLSDAELSTLKKNSTAFYDVVYKDLGGSKYLGRGPIQITGKNNYARIDKDLGLNGALVKDPDMLLRDPALANAASVQYLKNSGLHKKTFNDQRAAHQGVIHSIGGPSYAPGSKRGNSVLAQIEKYGPTAVAGTALAGASGDSGSAAKPSAAKPSDSAGEKVIQMPDFSKGYKVGDKFVPLTNKGQGDPTDYNQAYTKAKQSMGLSRDEAMKLAAAERRAVQSNQLYDEPTELKAIRQSPTKSIVPTTTPTPKSEPTPILPKTTATPEPSNKSVVPTKSKDDKETGSWDKVKTSNVPLEEQDQITESINKEIQDILRLSGKK